MVLEEKCLQSCSKMRSAANALCPIKSGWEEAFFPFNGPPLNWRPAQSIFVSLIEQHEHSHNCIVCLWGRFREHRVQLSSYEQLFTDLCDSSVHYIWEVITAIHVLESRRVSRLGFIIAIDIICLCARECHFLTGRVWRVSIKCFCKGETIHGHLLFLVKMWHREQWLQMGWTYP